MLLFSSIHLFSIQRILVQEQNIFKDHTAIQCFYFRPFIYFLSNEYWFKRRIFSKIIGQSNASIFVHSFIFYPKNIGSREEYFQRSQGYPMLLTSSIHLFSIQRILVQEKNIFKDHSPMECFYIRPFIYFLSKEYWFKRRIFSKITG